MASVVFQTTSASASGKLDSVYDMLLWFVRDKSLAKYRQIYEVKSTEGRIPSAYNKVRLTSGASRSIFQSERDGEFESDGRLYALGDITSSRPAGDGDLKEYAFQGRTFTPGRGEGEDERQVAVMFGPQYGPVTAIMVEDGIRVAARRGFDDLVFAAFGFDGAAQAAIQEDPDPKLRIHMAQIRPDVTMGDLLKTTVSSQLFTVSGSPRTRVEPVEDGQYVVHMEGVDIYDPVSNAVRSTGAEKVAAWFLDSDYDGRCFCVCQAFFPDRSAWDRLGRALGGALDEDAFARLSGTVSLPFPAGRHERVAIKVIDPRGNEVLRVHRLGKAGE